MKYNISVGQLVQVTDERNQRWYGILQGYFINIYGQEVIRLGCIGDTCITPKDTHKVFFGHTIRGVTVVNQGIS